MNKLSDRIGNRNVSPDYVALGSILPDPDPVLRKMGKDIAVYRELLTDPRVGSNVENRQAGVLSQLWDIDRGKSKSRISSFVAECINALDVYDITSQMLEAPLYGYKPIEVLWKPDGARIIPVELSGLPQEWFHFDADNNLCMRTKAVPQGINVNTPDYRYKFLLPRYRATYANPYGTRILARVFWYVVFKKGGLRFWVTFTEKYGMPWLTAKYRTDAGDAERNILLDSLEKMIADGICIFPEGNSVEALDVTTSGASANLYEKLLRFCCDEASIAILGHTGTTQGTPGRLGDEHSAQEVRKDIVDADATIAERAWNQLVHWIVDINFGPQSEYPRFQFYQEEDVDKDLAERDKTLYEIGVRFKEPYFVEAYNLPEGQFSLDNSPKQPAALPVSFAAPGAAVEPQEEIDTLINGLPPEILQEQAEKALAPVIDMIQKAESLEEIQRSIADLFPMLDTSGIEKTLEKAMLLSETWGRMNGGKR